MEFRAPEWANHTGQDGYGLWADASIADVVQRFRLIIPCVFTMGSPLSEEGRWKDEVQHEVTLTRPFWLATTAVTITMWNSVLPANSRSGPGGDHPATRISFDDSRELIKSLKPLVSGIRLPSEAEWEFACRAGTRSRFWSGDTSNDARQCAWYLDTAINKSTQPVGVLPPNPFGLYDMHGNVFERCTAGYRHYPTSSVVDPLGDPEDPNLSILRGGSWKSLERAIRSACRFVIDTDDRRDVDGIRLAVSA